MKIIALTFNFTDGNVAEVRQLFFLLSNFFHDVFIRGSCPISLIRPMSDWVKSYLKTTVVQIIDQLVVGIFMADKESGTDWATVSVFAIVN